MPDIKTKSRKCTSFFVILHFNFFFVVFLGKWFSITFQLSNCSILGDVTVILKQQGTSHPPEKRWIHPMTKVIA